MLTKWSVLTERLETARAEVARLESEMRGLEMTTHPDLKCSGCSEPLPTERAFAEHFRISNRIHLNLGECPNRKRCDECGKRMQAFDTADFCSHECWDAWAAENNSIDA